MRQSFNVSQVHIIEDRLIFLLCAAIFFSPALADVADHEETLHKVGHQVGYLSLFLFLIANLYLLGKLLRLPLVIAMLSEDNSVLSRRVNRMLHRMNPPLLRIHKVFNGLAFLAVVAHVILVEEGNVVLWCALGLIILLTLVGGLLHSARRLHLMHWYPTLRQVKPIALLFMIALAIAGHLLL